MNALRSRRPESFTRHARESGLTALRVSLLIALATGAVGVAQGLLAPDVARLLQQIKTADHDRLAVSEEDGRFLRVLVASSGARRALEIGAAHGYSTIWIGLGLRQTGGHLTRLAAIERALARHPGLFVTGSGFRGVGIPDCVADGRSTAVQVSEWLTAQVTEAPVPVPPTRA